MMIPSTGVIAVGVVKIRYFEGRLYRFCFYKLDWDVREESVMMISRFLVCVTGKMELPITEIGKAVRGT